MERRTVAVGGVIAAVAAVAAGFAVAFASAEPVREDTTPAGQVVETTQPATLTVRPAEKVAVQPSDPPASARGKVAPPAPKRDTGAVNNTVQDVEQDPAPEPVDVPVDEKGQPLNPTGAPNPPVPPPAGPEPDDGPGVPYGQAPDDPS